MCIIVYKPAGVEMPSRDRLANCFLNNPDGAGYMYLDRENEMVRVRKGFMAFASFMDSIQTVKNITDIPVVMHFRITTQGNTDQKNTHPFPVTGEHDALVSRTSMAKVAVAHNGIIRLTTSYSGYNTNNKEQYSDTYYFVRDYLSLIVDHNELWYQSKNNVKLARKLADSKLAVLGADGHCVLIGQFEKDDKDKCFYSNSTYKYATARYGSHGGYSGYSSLGRQFSFMDDDDDYAYDNVYTFVNSEEKQPDLSRWYGFRNNGELKSFLAAQVDEFTDVEELDTVDIVETVAAFMPEKGAAILNNNDGSLIDPNTDSYVYDMQGRVYWYDDKSNTIILLEDYEAVDADTYKTITADKDISCKFRALV